MKKPSKRVIIDTDMGWDDVLSILYLIKRPDIEIVGVTVTGCGETDLRWGVIIAKTLMELGKQTGASVCAGANVPLSYQHTFPRTFKNDMNDIMGLLGSLNPDINIKIDERPAWRFIHDTLNNVKESITILSLGGFTNLAMFIQNYPEAPIDKIDRIYAMAGAVYVDGNVALLNNAKPEWDQGPYYSTNYYAEWNVFIDPLAAKVVFDSEIPLTLVPLDACNHILLYPEYFKKITATDDIANLAKNIFKKKVGESSEDIPVPIFDPLATSIMAGGIKKYHIFEEYLDVIIDEDEQENHCGEIHVVDSGKRKLKIVNAASQHEFIMHFLEIINSNYPP